MLSRRTAAGLCVLVLFVFAVVLAVSPIHFLATSRSSFCTLNSGGARILLADGGSPQPKPIPFSASRGGVNTLVADGGSPQPKPIPFSVSRGAQTLAADGGSPQPPPIPFPRSREVLAA
jgi:hypothetical protein